MKVMKRTALAVVLFALAGTRLFADTTNYTPLPGDGTSPEWCDIASEADLDADGKTQPDTLRQRIEDYNKAGGDSKCQFLMFFLFRNKTISLKAPLILNNNLHDRTEGKGTPVMTGTYITGYGPGGETDKEGITIDGSNVTKDGKTCAITMKGGFAAEQQIHGITMIVQSANLAICDENGQDLLQAVSPYCDGKSKGKDCDFKDIKILVVGPGSGGGTPPTCDLSSGPNTGVIINPGILAERSLIQPISETPELAVNAVTRLRFPIGILGGGYKLTWKTTNATAVTINDGKATKTVDANGSEVVNPTAQTTYTLAATGPGGECQDVVVITPPAPKPPTCAFTSKDSDGGGFDLTWSSTDGTKITLNDGTTSETEKDSGTKHVSPDKSTTYVLSVDGASGACSRSITLENQAVIPPSPVCDLTSAASSGGGFDLTWTSADGATASLSDGTTTLSSDLNSSDPVHVDPTDATVYTLTVSGDGGHCLSSLALAPAPGGGTAGGTTGGGTTGGGTTGGSPDKSPAPAASQSCGLQLVAPPAEGFTEIMPFLSLFGAVGLLTWFRKRKGE